jgi:hypothetical protein
VGIQFQILDFFYPELKIRLRVVHPNPFGITSPIDSSGRFTDPELEAAWKIPWFIQAPGMLAGYRYWYDFNW